MIMQKHCFVLKNNGRTNKMKLTVIEDMKDFYGQGHLDYALTCMEEQGSFDKYASWLKTQPVATFTNDDEWEYDEDTKNIGYMIGSEDEEIFPVTLIIELNDDVIFHSALGSQSMFYKLNGDNSLKALYVD